MKAPAPRQKISPVPSQHPSGQPLLEHLLEPVALGAEVIDLVEHPVEQRLGRGGGPRVGAA